jgi:hypothetical protein
MGSVLVEIEQVGDLSVHNHLPIYSLEKLCFTVLLTLFNFQNFGHKLPAKIQLFTSKISQKTSFWEVMEQTKLDF